MATIISIVSYPFLPAKNGGQKSVALFNKYFSKYHTLIGVSTKKNILSGDEGYEVMRIFSNSSLRYINIFYFFSLRRIIREKKATHVLIEHPYYGWLGILLKSFCNIKLIVRSQNIEGLRWKTLGKWWWMVLWRYEKMTHRRADYNFFITYEDKRYAIENFRLDPAKCMTMTYGIEWNSAPPEEELQKARSFLREKYKIAQDETILLFNGDFDYEPNAAALKTIIQTIDPALEQKNGFKYKIIICGINIPEEIRSAAYSNIIIAGFVEDVGLYFRGAGVFINPVNEGGGIKTKLVEALGYNCNAVSTANGAVGVNAEWCNNKLLISDNNDWNGFADLIIKASQTDADIPEIYFEHFYWGYTTKKAALFIEQNMV